MVSRTAWLGERQLFRDEAASWLESSYPLSELLRVASTEPYPPLYALTLKAWMAVAGDGEGALRALSVAAALVTVAVAWRWGHEALGRWPGIAVLLVMSLSPVAIANARVARMYTLETAFATIAWWLVWRLVTGRATTPRARLLHAGVVAVAAAGEIWTMALGPPTAGLQFLFALGALLAWRRGRTGARSTATTRAASDDAYSGAKHAVAALVIAGLSFALWLPNLIPVATGGGAYWTPTPGPFDWAITWGTMLVGWRDEIFGWAAVRASALALAALGVAWLITRREPARALLGWAVVAGLLLTVAVWAVSLVRSIYDTRYLEASLPPLALAVAAGGSAIVAAAFRLATTWSANNARRSSVPGWAAVVAAALVGLFLLRALVPGTRAWLDEWRREVGLGPTRELIAALEPRLTPGDLLIALDARSYFTLAYEAEMYRREGDPLPPLRNWDSGNEPFYRGQTLIEPDATITSAEFAALGVRGTMPELADGGSVWLLAIANGRREDLDFGPVEMGALREVDRLIVERRSEAAQARQLQVAR